jgi:hypothetical protein
LQNIAFHTDTDDLYTIKVAVNSFDPKMRFDETMKYRWAIGQGFVETASLERIYGANASQHGDALAHNLPHQCAPNFGGCLGTM